MRHMYILYQLSLTHKRQTTHTNACDGQGKRPRQAAGWMRPGGSAPHYLPRAITGTVAIEA
eukprot:6207434-Prymnesium_polylepis.1